MRQRVASKADPYWAPDPAKSYLALLSAKPKQLRVAFSTKKLDGNPLHADCVAAIKEAAAHCERLGHIVEEATPDLNQTALIPAFMAFWAANLASAIDYIAKKPAQDKLPQRR